MLGVQRNNYYPCTRCNTLGSKISGGSTIDGHRWEPSRHETRVRGGEILGVGGASSCVAPERAKGEAREERCRKRRRRRRRREIYASWRGGRDRGIVWWQNARRPLERIESPRGRLKVAAGRTRAFGHAHHASALALRANTMCVYTRYCNTDTTGERLGLAARAHARCSVGRGRVCVCGQCCARPAQRRNSALLWRRYYVIAFVARKNRASSIRVPENIRKGMEHPRFFFSIPRERENSIMNDMQMPRVFFFFFTRSESSVFAWIFRENVLLTKKQTKIDPNPPALVIRVSFRDRANSIATAYAEQ